MLQDQCLLAIVHNPAISAARDPVQGGEPVCEMILADLSWHLPDIWWLTVAKEHTS